MNISEYYSKLFDIIYAFYGSVDGIDIILEQEALCKIQRIGKKIQLRFTSVHSNDINQEYLTFTVNHQCSDLNKIMQHITSLNTNDIQPIISLPEPLEFIQFLLTNTCLFQLNVKTIK